MEGSVSLWLFGFGLDLWEVAYHGGSMLLESYSPPDWTTEERQPLAPTHDPKGQVILHMEKQKQ